jgi:hypothetical protein
VKAWVLAEMRAAAARLAVLERRARVEMKAAWDA